MMITRLGRASLIASALLGAGSLPAAAIASGQSHHKAQGLTIPQRYQPKLLKQGYVPVRVRVHGSGRLKLGGLVRAGRRKAALGHTRRRFGHGGLIHLRLHIHPAARARLVACGPAKLVVHAVVRRDGTSHPARMHRIAKVRRDASRCSSSTAPATAGASSGRKPMIIDPGPGALWDPGRTEALNTAAALGVSSIRAELQWSLTAPASRPAGFVAADSSSPGYDFSGLDAFMRAAAARGLRVIVTVRGPGPSWASDTRDALSPRPADFGQFAGAVAGRYNGAYDPPGAAGVLPAAVAISVWNEPNLSVFLRPQYKSGSPYSPILYRRMYLAAQTAIEASAPGMPILIGETAPTGSFDSVDPAPFARGVLCLDFYAQAACQDGTIDAVGWATHPYALQAGDPFLPPKDSGAVTIGGLGNLETALDAGSSAGRLPPSFPVWMTEFGFESAPDPKGLPVGTQADYDSIAEYIGYADPRVATVAQYLVRDDPVGSLVSSLLGFQTGLLYLDGSPKPANSAFRQPLVVRRSGDAVSLWGLVRPAAGAASVSVLARDGDGAPFKVLDATTSSAGIFSGESDYAAGRSWQLVWHQPNGVNLAGPWTAAYSLP